MVVLSANAGNKNRVGDVHEEVDILRSKDDRLLEIAANLQVGERVTVGELAARYGVSEVTIRSDLDTLEQRQVITRVRGGAIRVAGGRAALDLNYISDFTYAVSSDREIKTAIAKAAANLIQDGDSLILDNSPINMFVADELLGKNARLLIATNSLPIASRLMLKESFQVIMPGGSVIRASESVSGKLGETLASQTKFKFGFFSANAVDAERGLLEMDLTNASVKRELLDHCQTPVALIESPNFSNPGIHVVASLKSFGLIITDDNISDRALKQIRIRNPEIHLADVE